MLREDNSGVFWPAKGYMYIEGCLFIHSVPIGLFVTKATSRKIFREGLKMRDESSRSYGDDRWMM